VDRGRLPQGARPDIPSTFGAEELRAIIPSGDRLILIYGGRYLATINGDLTERIFDFEAYRHPPKANPQYAEFAVQDVTHAQVKDGVLYVANGGGSYAREVFGKKGFLSAVDLGTGKLLWRSEPLVNNATFALSGDFILTAYGFTEEPDFLFALRRDTGAIVARTPLESGPSSVTVEGNRVHVEAYSNTYDFELR
jgi:outer membrane protein assembly factor BamB